LLPSDLIGTEIFREGSFRPHFGPLFHHLVLADEINRAPAKVQSALLEAMGERQVTIGHKTYLLPELFLVMATQNPLEQEGTYPLPEAQLDRFLLYVQIDYPDVIAEHDILRLNRQEAEHLKTNPLDKAIPLSQEELFAARQQVLKVYSDKLNRWLQFGASPRATIALDRCARAHAWLEDRDYVSPEDIHAMVPDVLRHRLILSFDAQADGLTTNDCINELLTSVPVP